METTELWMAATYGALAVTLALTLFVAGRHRSRGLQLIHVLHRRWYDAGLPLHRVTVPARVPARADHHHRPAHRRAA